MSWPTKCPNCCSALTNSKEFRHHMLEHWLQDTICPLCNEPKAVKVTQEGRMVSMKKFSSHLDIHLGERASKCTGCDKIFSNKCNMKRHFAKAHGGGVADSMTTGRNSVNGYIMPKAEEEASQHGDHTGGHSLVMGTTDIQMTTTTNGTGSLRSVKHICNVCNKQFVTSSKLKAHLATHKDQSISQGMQNLKVSVQT